ncbi:MAG: hypothetical protein ACRDNF_12960 [Streptosporangiaceae bacterium]
MPAYAGSPQVASTLGSSPVGADDPADWTVVAVVAVAGFAGIWWLVSARKWFTGPRVQGTPEELAAIERELAD